MLTRTDLQAVVPNVLQRLQEITDLPAHGTVAGQAVASLFFEELNLDMRGPVNDVDVFVSARGQALANSPLALFSSEQDTYHHIKFISAQKNLTIVSTSTEGALNTTLITYPGAIDEHIHSLTISQLLVEGFDLNGVAVGINLHSHEMVCTAEFLRFLEHREMKVVSTLTPAHTLVRLARKMYSGQLHNIECNYAQQRERLEQVLHLMNHTTFSLALGCVTSFGARYKNHIDFLSAHLPNVVEAPLRNDLFVFDIPVNEQREHFLNATLPLVQTLGKGGVSFLFHYNFDRLFDTIFSNQPYDVTVQQLVETAKDKTISDGMVLSQANQMIGGLPLVYPMEMDENDCAVLLMGYDGRNNPDDIQTMVDTYNNLSAFEKDIFGVYKDLNRLVEISQDPVAWAYAYIQQREGAAFEAWSNSLHDDHDTDVFVQLMQQVGANEELRAQLAVDFLDSHQGCLKHTFGLFNHLSPSNRDRAFESVMEHIYGGRNSVAALDLPDQRAMMDWMDHNSVSIADLLPDLHSETVVGFLMPNHRPETSPSNAQLNNISATLAFVSDDTLMENNGYILRHLLRSEYLPLLKDRVKNIDSKLWTIRWIEMVGSILLDQKSFEKKSLFETIMLFREIGVAQATSAKRKI